ncbi:hypothetical protein DM860_004604 [Cuscuta australis]|uniref:Uncharacterized protein n=1 Tax=Cuscuta australis TaxID=267555 RepID=A0A328EC23_9ASTE|nr:hypothetical protein DM860_004604 [Cuscuta australis]
MALARKYNTDEKTICCNNFSQIFGPIREWVTRILARMFPSTRILEVHGEIDDVARLQLSTSRGIQELQGKEYVNFHPTLKATAHPPHHIFKLATNFA